MDQTQMNDMQKAGAPAGAQAGAQGGLEQQGKDLAMRLLLASMKIIYSNPQGFIKVMQSGKTLQEGIVHATDIVVRKMMESVKGVPPEEVKKVYPMIGKGMGPVIARLLIQVAEAAGLTKGEKGAVPEQQPAGAPPAEEPEGAAAAEGGEPAADEEQDPSELEPDDDVDDEEEAA